MRRGPRQKYDPLEVQRIFDQVGEDARKQEERIEELEKKRDDPLPEADEVDAALQRRLFS